MSARHLGARSLINMERIKIVQVGRTHEHATGKLITLKKMPDIFEIVGVVDDRNDVRTPSFPSDQSCFDGLPMITMEQALNLPGLQAACIEVPNNQLVETTIPFAEHGLAIHMDKPAGTSLDDFKKLLDICKARKLPFQMGYMFRGNPAMKMVVESVHKGWIGDVFEIQCDMSHNYGGDTYQEYLGQMKGGIAYNLLCHLIDYITPLMGRPENIVSIRKSTANVRNDIENNCVVLFEYPHATATLRASSQEQGGSGARRLKVSGTKGFFDLCPLERFDGKPLLMTMHLKDGNEKYPAGTHIIDFGVQTDRYIVQLSELAKIIRGEIPNPCAYDMDLLVHELVLRSSGYAL